MKIKPTIIIITLNMLSINFLFGTIYSKQQQKPIMPPPSQTSIISAQSITSAQSCSQLGDPIAGLLSKYRSALNARDAASITFRNSEIYYNSLSINDPNKQSANDAMFSAKATLDNATMNLANAKTDLDAKARGVCIY